MCIGNFNSDNIAKETSLAMWVSFLVMVILLVWCFIVPPRGENAAETLKACALLYAVIPSAIVREAIKEGKGKNFQIKHGDTSIEIEGKDG